LQLGFEELVLTRLLWTIIGLSSLPADGGATLQAKSGQLTGSGTGGGPWVVVPVVDGMVLVDVVATVVVVASGVVEVVCSVVVAAVVVVVVVVLSVVVL